MAGVNQLAQTPELRNKLMWTVLILCAYRVGVHVPVPGINVDALSHFFASMQGSVFALLDMFSGGGLRNVSVFALGIMPYISASIILQLLQVVSPDIKRMAKEEGQAGRRKITQYTRYLTVLITIIQGFGIAALLEGMTSPDNLPVVQSPGWEFKVVTIITLTAGTILIMWLGEQITAKGIGNGISLIIFSGIVVGTPTAIARTYEQIRAGDMNVVLALVLLAGMQAIDTALYDAARVDGANAFGQMRHVTLPGLKPVLLFVSVNSCIAAFKTFEQVQTMTGGDPLYSTTTIVHQIYQRGFGEYKMGYAASMSVVLLIMLLIVTALNFRAYGMEE